MLGKTHSQEALNKISKANKGKIIYESTKEKMRERIACPYCEKSGAKTIMKRWYFDNCKKIKNNDSAYKY